MSATRQITETHTLSLTHTTLSLSLSLSLFMSLSRFQEARLVCTALPIVEQWAVVHIKGVKKGGIIPL